MKPILPKRYAKSKIYKLQCSDGYYYIGSTINKLEARFNNHIHDSKRFQKRQLYKHINTLGWNNVKISLIEAYPCNSKEELLLRETYYINIAHSKKDKLCLNVNKALITLEQRKQNLKIYYNSNKEKIKIRQSNYIKTHRDKLKEYFKQYNAKHSEKRNAYQKQYVIDNKESVKKARQLQYQKNKEEADEYSKQWCKEHPEKSRAYKKKWTENNYEKVQQKRRETREKMESIECECGGIFKPYNKSAHIKSKRHNNFINALTTVTV